METVASHLREQGFVVVASGNVSGRTKIYTCARAVGLEDLFYAELVRGDGLIMFVCLSVCLSACLSVCPSLSFAMYVEQTLVRACVRVPTARREKAVTKIARKKEKKKTQIDATTITAYEYYRCVLMAQRQPLLK